MAKVKLTMDRGQTFFITFKLRDSEGNVMNLTGYNARLQARTMADKTGILILDLDSFTQTLSLNPTEGEIGANLTWYDTREYSAGNYPYELELISPDDTRFIVVSGILTVKDGVIL